ncbi:hypothetical protein PARPLA_02490 [Rhodobacteraceae bacterium THAF1]|uniref:copper chaperone PCu(A)C n=1 Tax=Palleronia sp. THAF1 TaxID=2587842 RepID=UPI000F3B035A|nr:copper chaperone PCu(A)C [Palleronia sp. THAF1]QFU07970.1 hypothetical protein FIU81_04725 [Palleronia sp. THAF1]VDC27821.1 hypothetical protein PARPLA_02490 [Rhodobacteraceae bacterium THAF1]
MKLLLSTVAAALCATALSAHDYSVGKITINHPYIAESAGMARTAAGYMTVTNAGDTPDRLIAARAEGVPTTMIHETVMEGDIAKMMHLEAVEIGAGESIIFQPAGRHVMFMGLDGTPLKDGDTLNATLVFETAGDVDVTFNVEPRDGTAMDHEGMDHGNMPATN